MPELAHKLLNHIRRQSLIRPGDRVSVAVSGGADSVALLRLLCELRSELGIVLSVAHFNHQLRGAESDADKRFVAELAARHKLQFHCGRGDVRSIAGEKHLSLEAAARHCRYDFFRALVVDGNANRIATAHTLDDQAETVLLRIVRGAGTRGLAGIYPCVAIEPTSTSAQAATIVRPLLGIRREELKAYLTSIDQLWREDPSNRDLRHARNRVRHGILPRLERNLNPAARKALAEAAEIARAEEQYWDHEVSRELPAVWNHEERRLRIDDNHRGNTERLAEFPLAMQRRLVRAAAESLGIRLEFRQVEEILGLCVAELGSSTGLPGGWVVSRGRESLRFDTAEDNPCDYEYKLQLPGRIELPELSSRLEALVVRPSSSQGYNREHLLSSGLLGKQLTIRNWRPGDRFWPAHTKAAKKVKELLAEKHITGSERKLWPVIVAEGEIIWMRGFPSPTHLLPGEAEIDAVLIREVGSSEEHAL